MISFAKILLKISLFIDLIYSIESNRPKLNEFQKNQTGLIGTKFSLLCSIQHGTSPFEFEWLFNERVLSKLSKQPPPLSSSTLNRIDRIRISMIDDDQTVLTINHLHQDDFGQYSCLARNRFGFDRQSTFLRVKGSIVILYRLKKGFGFGPFFFLLI